MIEGIKLLLGSTLLAIGLLLIHPGLLAAGAGIVILIAYIAQNENKDKQP